MITRTAMTARAPAPRRALASAVIAAAATALVCLPFAPGWFGLAGLLLAAGAVLSGGLAVWVMLPQAMVALVPALIPSPMFLLTFAWELALLALAAAVFLHGWRQRAAWLHHLSGVEWAVLAFTLWALFSGFWSTDLRLYLLGARRLLMGLCALWVASRLPWIASRRWFDFGLIGGASALALSAIQRSLTSGLSAMQALLHRTEVTNLGWGTANYVATLLLLCAPSLLRLGLRGGQPERSLAWIAFALVTTVQFIVASRAVTVLFVVGTLLQLLRAAKGFRVWVGVGFAAALTALISSPLGYGLVSRLDNVRELGSMTIRLWYFRESWRRLVEHLPWGMGLWQGYGNADRLHGTDPHNYWLLVGGDLGAPGVLLWTAVLVAIVRRWRALRRDAPGREQAHALLLTFALANLHTLVEPTFQGAHYQLLFYWVVCGTLAYASAENSGTAVSVVSPSQVAPAGALAPPRAAPSGA